MANANIRPVPSGPPRVSMNCPAGDPEIGMYHAHVNKRRVVVGWNHNNDTPDGREQGKMWGWVHNNSFHVYDQDYNRGAQGEYSPCGHANFTMIRIFHPFFCYGDSELDPDKRARMRVPQDMVWKDKEMCRNRWRDIMLRNPHIPDEDEGRQEHGQDIRARSFSHCGDTDVDNGSTNSHADSDDDKDLASLSDNLSNHSSHQARRPFNSTPFHRRSSMITTSADTHSEDDDDGDATQGLSSIDKLKVSDPFGLKLKRRQNSRSEQSRKRRWRRMSQNSDEDHGDDDDGIDNPSRRSARMGFTPSNIPAQRGMLSRLQTQANFSVPKLPSLPPSECSSSHNQFLLDAATRMGPLSPSPIRSWEVTPIRYSQHDENSLFVPEVTAEVTQNGVSAASAIEVKDEEDDDDAIIEIKGEDHSYDWNRIVKPRGPGLVDNPIVID